MPGTSKPEPPPAEHRSRRPRRGGRLVVVLLLVVALGAGASAVVLARPDAPPARSASGPALATPVLSVRRLPSVLAAPIAERRLRQDLSTTVAALPPDSCVVVRSATGEEVLAHRPDVPLRPASGQKLLTAATVLEVLDPSTRFTTRVLRTGPLRDGVVEGDLVLVGGGDPVLGTADYAARYRNQPQLFTDLDRLALALVDAGVRRVTGAVVGDESRYDDARTVRAGWPERYQTSHQVGPLSALSVNDGFASYPAHTGANDPAEPAPDPAVHAAAMLQGLLRFRGVVAGGAPRAGRAPAGAVELAAIESAPVGEIVDAMLRESDNQTAELLLKELGRTAGTPSTAGGAAVVAATLDRDAPADGSGLSLDDRASCRELLALFDRPTTGELLDDGLAVAGRSGTLLRRFADTPLVGRLRGKSGSLNTVQSLTGAVEDDDGVLRFAVIVTVPEPGRVPDRVAGDVQRLAQTLLDQPRLADEDVLEPVPVAAS